jgi:uncharacterized protein YidB (DUF937 family)
MEVAEYTARVMEQRAPGTLLAWIGTGPNEPAAPRDIADALGPDVIDALSQRTGLPREQVTAILSQVLPQAVDKLTPHGRLPTHEELTRAG